MPSPSSPAPGTRPHNLARILRLVHEEGAQSRAALTETTGLNRSTIADLVGGPAVSAAMIRSAPKRKSTCLA